VQSYPALQNPITNYLASKPDDSAAEGRLKNALEGVVMDATLTGALVLVSKSIKMFRAGDIEGANKAASEADAGFAKAADADYQAKRFFDHEAMLQEQQAQADAARVQAAKDAEAATVRASQADDQSGRTKNFLNAPTEAPVPDSAWQVKR